MQSPWRSNLEFKNLYHLSRALKVPLFYLLYRKVRRPSPFLIFSFDEELQGRIINLPVVRSCRYWERGLTYLNYCCCNSICWFAIESFLPLFNVENIYVQPTVCYFHQCLVSMSSRETKILSKYQPVRSMGQDSCMQVGLSVKNE